MIRLVLALVILLSVLPMIHAQDADACTPATGTPIRFGAVFPAGLLMTEISASENGVLAMVTAINECGGVEGRPVELVRRHADSRDAASAAAQALITEEGLALIIGSGTFAVQQGLLAATEETSVILWEVSQPLDVEAHYAFSPAPSSAQLGAEAARYIRESLVLQFNITAPKVAFFYDERNGTAISTGFTGTYGPPVMNRAVDEDSYFGEDAERIRDQGINFVVTAMLDAALDELWYGLQYADANPAALIYIGSEGVRTTLCSRYTSDEGVISITATGTVNEDYRANHPDAAIFHAYERAYVRQNSQEANRAADLAASGVYLLLRHLLPNAEDFSAEGIRAAILNTDLPAPIGYMGEGVQFDSTPTNLAASIFVQQRQDGRLCRLSTGSPEIATCMEDVQPLMTWRERALSLSGYSCYGSAY